jgi:Fur family transcriptional regulator, ferric uptake regulator
MIVAVSGKDESAALAERLLGVGVRPTHQRMRVLETLAAEPHDATAQEIHARLREEGERVGLATVYRALSLLREREVVDELSHRTGESCYRLCTPGHHHHLVCSSCHRVDELEGCDVDAWVAQASKMHGFQPASHTLEVVGVCADCRRAQRTGSGARGSY